METQQASIITAIKAIRSSRKRVDKLAVCKFIKKELQSISNEESDEILSHTIEDETDSFITIDV